MKKIIVKGGGLTDGTFEVSGYKHAANVLICASLAINDKIEINNVPQISDTKVLCQILEQLGASCELEGNRLCIDSSEISDSIVPDDLSGLSHAAIYLLPVLLGKLGTAQLGKTGGCMIGDKEKKGERPIHHMLAVLEEFGADFKEGEDTIVGESKSLKACEIDIARFSERDDVVTGPLISGATKTAILAALFTKEGITVIKNPYRKPDVMELLEFAVNNGYKVDFVDNAIHIERRDEQKKELKHDLLDDISTVMTYITAAIYNNISLRIRLRYPEKVKAGLKAEMDLFEQIGVQLEWEDQLLLVSGNQILKGVDIEVTSRSIYSDHQPFYALILSKANSGSSISEFVWTNRFSYAHEINKLASIHPFSETDEKLYITPSMLDKGGQVLTAADLRSAAVLLLASIGVNGNTVIENIDHLERGYEDLIGNLVTLNANIQYIS